MTLCSPGPRDNCVVDGDTIWLGGEKIRIADIDAPEVSQPQCSAEKELGDKATKRLLALLNAKTFTVRRQGTDRYGRTLAILVNADGSIGDKLVREGLARRWTGKREPWC